MYFFVFRLRAVGPQLQPYSPQLQPHGPQLENGVLVDAQRVFIQCIVTFMLRHYRLFCLCLWRADAACFFAANRDIKSPFHPLSLMDKGMWRVKGECV